MENVDLNQLPILLHLAQDGGHYIASNVVITNDPELGRNMCYHRLLRLDSKRFAARIVERRGTYNAMQKVEGDLPVAICIGVSLATHLAASMSPPPDEDEALHHEDLHVVANVLGAGQLHIEVGLPQELGPRDTVVVLPETPGTSLVALMGHLGQIATAP